MINSAPHRPAATPVFAAPVFTLILALMLTATAPAAADSLLPVIPPAAAGAEQRDRRVCVAPNDIMRRQHFTFILHQRDETVHRGIRTPRYRFAGCVSCHATQTADGRYNPINAPGEFCAVCHEYTAVSIDCFDCHAAVPDSAAAVTAPADTADTRH